MFCALFVISNLYQFLLHHFGLLINVFEKSRTEVKQDGNTIEFKAIVPKYARYQVFPYVIGNKLTDKLGITISLKKIEFNFKFDTEEY